MAVFPQGFAQVQRRCNPGERRVLLQLQRCLEDDHLVWHDVPIGPKGLQPDFVIVGQRWGVLLLETKDWKRSTLAGATRDRVMLNTERGCVAAENPLRQVRGHALELVDQLRRDALLVHQEGPFRGRLLFPYGFGVVMSGLRRAELSGTDFGDVFPEHLTLLRDDLDETVTPDAFRRRLWGLFTVTYPHTLSLPERDRIRWHLFPEVRMPAQGELDLASAPVEIPDLMQVMDLQQEQIARSLGEGHRVIHGAAGSGKTMILVFRAEQLARAARPERPVLVLCYNRMLAERIDTMLRRRGVDDRVQVRTFHGWCQDMVRSFQIDVPSAAGDRDGYFDALAAAVDRAVERGFVPGGQYSALLIDEAHDFEDAWLRIAVRMVDPGTKSLLVLYDDAQSIYQTRRRRFNFASVGVEARGRTSILKLNYRNTSEVLMLAMHVARKLLAADLEPVAADAEDDGLRRVQPASAGRHGPLPVLLEARSEHEEAELVAERIAGALGDGLSPDDVAVLVRARRLLPPVERALGRRGIALRSMARRPPAVRQQGASVNLLTMHSAKGLEFPLVLLVGLQALPMRGESEEDALRLLYVAMTRATQRLVLSAHAPSVAVARVKEGLAACAAHGSG